MIWDIFFGFFVDFLNLVFSFLPHVAALPLGIDGFMVTAVGYWMSFMAICWPLVPLWNCLLWYIPIQVGLIVLKLFIGSRMPMANTISY